MLTEGDKCPQCGEYAMPKLRPGEHATARRCQVCSTMKQHEKIDNGLDWRALANHKYDHPPAEVSRDRERVLIREAEREAGRRRAAAGACA